MAVNIQEMIARYQRGVAGGGTNYRAGVAGKGTEWQQNASSDEAEARYAAGVQRAAAQKSRQKAVQQKSGSDWEVAATEVGAANYQAASVKAGENYAQVAGDIAAAADAGQAAAAAIPGEDMASRLQRGPAAATAIHRHWARVKGIQPEV